MKAKTFCLLAIIVSLFTQELIAQQTEPRVLRETNSLSGKVTDSFGNPLIAASVYIPDLKIGTQTMVDGYFIFRNIAPGRHLIEVSYVGYSTLTDYLDINGDIVKNFILSPSILENNEVVVTGVTTATQIRRSPVPVRIVRKEDLMKGVAVNLIDGLSKEPGISQISTGPSISKPVIRGLGYNRVVVVNDGVRQEGQQWGDEHGIEIDEYSVSKVEILKGPASLMYGSDALAGVINIISNPTLPSGTIRGNIISNYQSNNQLRGVGANLGGNNKGFSWNAYGSLKAASDYKNPFDGHVYNSKFNEKNWGGFLGLNGSRGYTHLIVSNFRQALGIVEGERDNNGNFIKRLQGGIEAVPSDDDFKSTDPQIPHQHINHFKIVWDNSVWFGKGRVAINMSYQRNKRIEYGNADQPDEQELFFDLETFTLNEIIHNPEKNGWKTSFGGTAMKQENKNRGTEVLIPEYKLWDAGAFWYTQKKINKLSLSGGIRFDTRLMESQLLQEGAVVKFPGFKKSFLNLSASAGLSYQSTPRLVWRLNLARGFRAPNMPELSSNGVHEGSNRYEYGNLDLKSETSLQADAGMDWNTEHLSFSASLFYNNINNFIFYRKLQSVSGGDSLVEVDNDFIPAFKFDQRRASLAGFELSLDIHPHPLDWLHIENSFSFVNGKLSEAIEGTRNLPLIPAPKLLSELRGDFLTKGKFIRNLSLKLEADIVFAQNKPFAAFNTETPTPGYTLINTGFNFDMMIKEKTLFSLYFVIQNIADIAYQNHLSRLKYTDTNPITGRIGVFGMGRNFSIKLNIPLSWSLVKD